MFASTTCDKVCRSSAAAMVRSFGTPTAGGRWPVPLSLLVALKLQDHGQPTFRQNAGGSFLLLRNISSVLVEQPHKGFTK